MQLTAICPHTPKLAPIYRDFGPADLAPHLDAFGITHTVLVQAAPTEAEQAAAIEERHADHRADLEVHHALGRAELVVAHRVVVGQRAHQSPPCVLVSRYYSAAAGV